MCVCMTDMSEVKPVDALTEQLWPHFPWPKNVCTQLPTECIVANHPAFCRTVLLFALNILLSCKFCKAKCPAN